MLLLMRRLPACCRLGPLALRRLARKAQRSDASASGRLSAENGRSVEASLVQPIILELANENR